MRGKTAEPLGFFTAADAKPPRGKNRGIAGSTDRALVRRGPGCSGHGHRRREMPLVTTGYASPSACVPGYACTPNGLGFAVSYSDVKPQPAAWSCASLL